MRTEPILVHWYDCNCEWITKYCDEYHQKSAYIPADVVREYA